MISSRSADANPPRKTLVGVAGKGLNLGHSVEAMMTTFPETKPRTTGLPTIALAISR